MLKKKKRNGGQIALNLFFILLCMCYILPLILSISISFEGAKNQYFSLFPNEFSLQAYESIFAKPDRIIRAYGVTIFGSVLATAGQLIVISMFAYALSKRDFAHRNWLTFVAFFTTLFNGGMVSSYLVNTTMLGLYDSIWVYVFPSLMNAWNMIVIRTFFQGLPGDLFEAARIDGSSEFGIYMRIALPLSTPALASVGFLNFISKWNEWSTTELYIRTPEKFTLQYLLRLILDSEESLREMIESGMASADAELQLQNLESMRFAMAVVAVGPVCLLFPLFQKYFAKGMTLGSVKG